MAIRFEGIGNLGDDPQRKTVEVDGEERELVFLRVKFDRVVPDGDGGFKDHGGFWRDVAVWRKTLGDHVIAHLSKGVRVFVQGEEVAKPWTDKHEQKRESYSLVAHYIAPDFLGIEAITYAPRRGRDAA